MKMKSPLYAHRQQGFNLLEVLIAVVVLSFGLLGVAGLQITSLKTAHNSYQTQQATFYMHEILERMRGNRNAVHAGHYKHAAGSSCGFTTNNCQSAACSAKEIAKVDIQQVLCGSGTGGLKTQLVSGDLEITCPTNDCEEKVKITVSWKNRVLDSKTPNDKTHDGKGGRPSSIFIESVL